MSDGTGRIYQRGDTWWIDYSFRGTRHRESSGSTRKKDAQALLRKRMEEMGNGGPRVHEEDVTVGDLRDAVVNDYKVNDRASIDRMRRAFDRVVDHFGADARAVDVTTDRVKAYVAARRDAGMANATVNKELAALRRGFNLLKQAGRLSTTPHVPTLSTNNTRTNFLTDADVAAVCDEIAPPLVPVVRFAALTGWRKGEIFDLRWRHVDFDAGVVTLAPGTTKNRDGRTFPFAALPPLEEVLRRQRDRTDAVEKDTGRIVPHVFHRDGDPIKSMRTAWNKAAARAGVPDAWFHDLRRTAVRNLERAGVPRSVATELTGHKTEAVYRRYAIADEDALHEGVEKLAALHDDDPNADGRGDRTAVPFPDAREARS